MTSSFGPIRDQGSIGWCYAHTSADLIGYWLQNHMGVNTKKVDDMVSAAAIALDNNKELRTQAFEIKTADPLERKKAEEKLSALRKRQNDLREKIIEERRPLKLLNDRVRSLTAQLDGGDVKEQAKQALYDEAVKLEIQLEDELDKVKELTDAVQDQRAFEEENSKYLNGNFDVDEGQGGSPSEALAKEFKNGICFERDVHSFEERVKSNQLTPLKLSETLAAFKMYSENSKNLCEASREMRSIFNISLDDSIKILLQTAPDSPLLEKSVGKACHRLSIPEKKAPMILTMEGDTTDERKEMMNAIDQQLSRKNPVEITIDGRMFDYPPELATNEQIPNGRHSVVVVGKRWNCEARQPEYILRNSWGVESCTKKRSNYRLDPDSEGPEAAKLTACIVSCDTCDPTSGFVNFVACSSKSNRCIEKCHLKFKYTKKRVPAPYRCENGNFVLRADALSKNLFEMTYLK